MVRVRTNRQGSSGTDLVHVLSAKVLSKSVFHSEPVPQIGAPTLFEAVLIAVWQRSIPQVCLSCRVGNKPKIYTSFPILVRSGALGSLWPSCYFGAHGQCSRPVGVHAGSFEFARPIATSFEFLARAKVPAT